MRPRSIERTPINASDKQKSKWIYFKKNYGGYLYMLPVILGIIIFTVVPMGMSLVYSFCDYNFYMYETKDMYTNFGFQNYIKMFTDDWAGLSNSLIITFRYAVVTVVVFMVGSYILALFLNQKLKGIAAFRVIYYLPCLIPAVVSSLLWRNITDVDTGYINLLLETMGLGRYSFYSQKETVFPSILLLGVVNWGGNMIMWLAQIKNIPAELYEAADIDGAGYLRKVFMITIPLSTAMIFYILIVSIIGALQVFSAYYPLINGVNRSELNFIVIKIYDTAFVEYDISYASALSWLLFIIIGLLTAVIFKTSKWVYYGEAQ